MMAININSILILKFIVPPKIKVSIFVVLDKEESSEGKDLIINGKGSVNCE